jgi:hypothetical protein
MTIEILSRQASGICSLTGKSGIEVWAIRANGGETQMISTQRLPEVLRVLMSVGEAKIAAPAPPDAGSRLKPAS